MNLLRWDEHSQRWLATPARGAVIPVAKLSELAHAWASDELAPDWQPRSDEQSQAILDQLELTGDFWRLARLGPVSVTGALAGVDDSLDHVTCTECGSNVVTVLLSSGRALCASCAGYAGEGLGAHLAWPGARRRQRFDAADHLAAEGR